MTHQAIGIPTAWSADQARTVAGFLDEVFALVWALHDELREPDWLGSEPDDETPPDDTTAGPASRHPAAVDGIRS